MQWGSDMYPLRREMRSIPLSEEKGTLWRPSACWMESWPHRGDRATSGWTCPAPGTESWPPSS